MMLLGRLFCRLSVVISAQVTWKPVIRWWGATLDTRHRKLPVMFPSLMENDAVRFSGLAKTLGGAGAVRRKKGWSQSAKSRKICLLVYALWRVIPYGIYIVLVKSELTVGSLIMS